MKKTIYKKKKQYENEDQNWKLSKIKSNSQRTK